MDGISVAESSKHKKTPKVLHHLELHPKMGGGDTITHHHTSYQHPPEEHHFGPDDHKGFYAHISKHSGRPLPQIAQIDEGGESEPEPWYEHETRKKE